MVAKDFIVIEIPNFPETLIFKPLHEFGTALFSLDFDRLVDGPQSSRIRQGIRLWFELAGYYCDVPGRMHIARISSPAHDKGLRGRP